MEEDVDYEYRRCAMFARYRPLLWDGDLYQDNHSLSSFSAASTFRPLLHGPWRGAPSGEKILIMNNECVAPFAQVFAGWYNTEIFVIRLARLHRFFAFQKVWIGSTLPLIGCCLFFFRRCLPMTVAWHLTTGTDG